MEELTGLELSEFRAVQDMVEKLSPWGMFGD